MKELRSVTLGLLWGGAVLLSTALPVQAIAQPTLPQKPSSKAIATIPNTPESTQATNPPLPHASTPPSTPTSSTPLDLPPETLESPLLQRWLREIPNVRDEIRNDPAFRTRLRAGYAYFPREEVSGFSVGIEDIFVGRTGLTLSGEYQQGSGGSPEMFGADLRYYLRPLGSYVNIAPVVGYRHLETSAYATEGLNLGARVLLALSRTGAADVSLTQSWVAPGSDDEVGITTLSFGYAVTRDLRLSTDIQKRNTPQRRDSRVGVLLEWML